MNTINIPTIESDAYLSEHLLVPWEIEPVMPPLDRHGLLNGGGCFSKAVLVHQQPAERFNKEPTASKVGVISLDEAQAYQFIEYRVQAFDRIFFNIGISDEEVFQAIDDMGSRCLVIDDRKNMNNGLIQNRKPVVGVDQFFMLPAKSCYGQM